jgi:hypothetical protein
VGGELADLDAFVEDEIGLEPRIGEEETSAELGQAVTVRWHVRCLLGSVLDGAATS